MATPRWTQAQMREVVREERVGIGLAELDRFDPYALAEEHGIRIYSLDSLRHHDLPPAALAHFHRANSGSWSAALLPLGTARIIVENDSHVEARRRNSISHELGHHLLEHEFGPALFDDHARAYSKAHEKQADFTAAELLLPWPAALQAAFADWPNSTVARAYGVSEQFAQWRMAGPRKVAQRSVRRRNRPL